MKTLTELGKSAFQHDERFMLSAQNLVARMTAKKMKDVLSSKGAWDNLFESESYVREVVRVQEMWVQHRAYWYN